MAHHVSDDFPGFLMTDSRTEMEANIAQNYRLVDLAFGDPQLAAARATAEPMQMYTDLTARWPVGSSPTTYSLLTMEDILYVNKHHSIEQGSKYLGSDRPAIPLGLDGAEHRSTAGCSTRCSPPSGSRPWPTASPAGRRADRRVHRATAVSTPTPRGVSRCRRRSSCRSWACRWPTSTSSSTSRTSRSATRTRGPRRGAAARPPEEAVQWIHQYFDRDLDARASEAAPRDDMIGWLMTAEVDGQRLTPGGHARTSWGC